MSGTKTRTPGKLSAGYSRDKATGRVDIHLSGKLLERLPPTTGSIEALQEIHMNLASATVLYREHGDGGRLGVYRAIMDTVDYFAGQGIPRAVLEPLSAVAAAIVDADDGAESPIFKPDREGTGGKPRKSIAHLVEDGHLAVVMQCCVLHCRSEGMRPFLEPAAQMAASMIRQSSWPVHVNATQLRKTRERIMASPRTSPDRALFEELMSSEIGQDKPLEWAKVLLQHDWVSNAPREESS